MSRHRNVRNANFQDDYDGYDDVYGHSVEDDYPASPSVSQFFYDRSKAPQISQFFSPENDITEEPEDSGSDRVERTRQRFDSLTLDSAVEEAMADLVPEEEMLLKARLDEIHNVVGDSFPDNVIISHILHAKFNGEKALDNLLNGKQIDPTMITHQTKKLKPESKPQPAKPAIAKPKPIKLKEPPLKGNMVKSSPSSTTSPPSSIQHASTAVMVLNGSAPSLLESIALDHYKKCIPPGAGATSTSTADTCAQQQQQQQPFRKFHPLIGEDELEKTTKAIGNPLMTSATSAASAAHRNPLLALKTLNISPGTGSSSPINVNIPITSPFPGVTLTPEESTTNPLKKISPAPSLESLTRDCSPSALSKNPLFNCNHLPSSSQQVGGGGGAGVAVNFCSNPLLAVTPKIPVVVPNGLPLQLSNPLLPNPLLSLGSLPIIPKKTVEVTPALKPQQHPIQTLSGPKGTTPTNNNNNNRSRSTSLSQESDFKTEAPPPQVTPPKESLPLPPAAPPPPPVKKTYPLSNPKFKPKPKREYEHGIVSSGNKRRPEQISCYPVPFDESHLDRSLIKTQPSLLGLRLVRNQNKYSCLDLDTPQQQQQQHRNVGVTSS